MCKSKFDQAKNGLQSNQNWEISLNCNASVGGDGMRTEGVNTVSVYGKILREEIRLRSLSFRKHYRKLVGYHIPIIFPTFNAAWIALLLLFYEFKQYVQSIIFIDSLINFFQISHQWFNIFIVLLPDRIYFYIKFLGVLFWIIRRVGIRFLLYKLSHHCHNTYNNNVLNNPGKFHNDLCKYNNQHVLMFLYQTHHTFPLSLKRCFPVSINHYIYNKSNEILHIIW